MHLTHPQSAPNVRSNGYNSRRRQEVKSVQTSKGVQSRSVTVTAPSTSANLGPGFDVFGLALDAFHDKVEIAASTGGLELEITGPNSEDVPLAPEMNSAGLAVKELLARLGLNVGIKIRIQKGVPVAKGLGSSAASAAAAVVGLNHMLDLNLSPNKLVHAAARGEKAVAGAAHADNAAAAVLGGFILIQSHSPFSAVSFPAPRAMEIALAIPDVQTAHNKTAVARSVIPDRVPLGNVTRNVGNAASIVAGFLSGDIGLIGRGMVDTIVEPARAHLVPGYSEVRKAALEAGAAGAAISGAGPTMIAIVDSMKAPASPVAKAMKNALESTGVGCRALVTKPACGAVVQGVGES